MKLIFASLLAIVQLNVAHGYLWRLYNNGGCDSNSPASVTGSAIPVEQCVTTPQGGTWNKVEIDDNSLLVTVYCNAGCTGASLDNRGTNCNSVVDGCVIGSFVACEVLNQSSIGCKLTYEQCDSPYISVVTSGLVMNRSSETSL
ncbi:hypothetical protein C8R44DRAFT_731695 [Mycena epipterygia]|nr:hypothetical protein C8R44DRAFT_731695 [Mycena epipterygia]